MKKILTFLAMSVALYASGPVKTGLDNVTSFVEIFQNQRIGIITNHTAYNKSGLHIVDVFGAMKTVQIKALFGPEHGIRGDTDAGGKIADENDPLRNIPIYSLYGKTLKPTPEMLKDIDILVFDIQDIGARFYTYVWTMALAIEAAAEHDIRFVVLDRPNPITGNHVEGNILDMNYSTFVGKYPIPVRHGMTIGELAMMFNGEGWFQNQTQCDLQIISVKNWQREMWYDKTELSFIKPSPNIPDLMTAIVYPGMCMLEGTNVSEGRGTQEPFKIFGAPWIDSAKLTARLNQLGLPGVRFEPAEFTPVSIPRMSSYPKLRNLACFGSRIVVTDRNLFEAYWTGILVVNTIHHLYPDSLQWRIKHFDRLCGTDAVRKSIIETGDLNRLRQSWQMQLDMFMKKRSEYLLY